MSRRNKASKFADKLSAITPQMHSPSLEHSLRLYGAGQECHASLTMLSHKKSSRQIKVVLRETVVTLGIRNKATHTKNVNKIESPCIPRLVYSEHMAELSAKEGNTTKRKPKAKFCRHRFIAVLGNSAKRSLLNKSVN